MSSTSDVIERDVLVGVGCSAHIVAFFAGKWKGGEGGAGEWRSRGGCLHPIDSGVHLLDGVSCGIHRLQRQATLMRYEKSTKITKNMSNLHIACHSTLLRLEREQKSSVTISGQQSEHVQYMPTLTPA